MALFDCASDNSYVTQELVDQTGPKKLKTCKVAYAPFGGEGVENG